MVWSNQAVESITIPSGATSGARIVIDANGIIEYDENNNPVIQITTTGDNFIQITDANGNTLSSLDSLGNISGGIGTFDSLIAQSINYQGEELATYIQTFCQGIVVAANRTPAKTFGIQSEYGLLGFTVDWGSLNSTIFNNNPGDRIWKVHINGQISANSFIGGDVLDVRIRYRAGTSNATITDTILSGWLIPITSTKPINIIIDDIFETLDTGNVESYILTCQVLGGSGSNVSSNSDWWVAFEDSGLQPPIQGFANNGGGTRYSGSDSGGSGGGGTQSVTKTYTATWSANYKGNGNYDSFFGTGQNLHQGYYDGTNGNQQSLIGFPTGQIQADIGSGTVTKVELFLYANHWYPNSGGTAIIGFSGLTGSNANPPNNIGNPSSNIFQVSGYAYPGGQWILINHNAQFWATGAYSAICVGPGPSQSHVYYGVYNGDQQAHPPQLKITWSK
ncbi:MAG: hypothetical protein ACREHG_10160 [Candidatus Saccharimonadales bacterium]